MAGYVLVQFTVNDPEEFRAYVVESLETVRAFGGELLIRGAPEVLHGQAPHQITALLEFADVAAARRWYQSPDYQRLIARRDSSAQNVFLLHERLAGGIAAMLG